MLAVVWPAALGTPNCSRDTDLMSMGCLCVQEIWSVPGVCEYISMERHVDLTDNIIVPCDVNQCTPFTRCSVNLIDLLCFIQVHHLLNNGAEVNQRDNRGFTPLHRAAYLAHLNDGYLEIYEYLLVRLVLADMLAFS